MTDPIVPQLSSLAALLAILCAPFLLGGQGFTFTIQVIRAGQRSNTLECQALQPEKVFVVFPRFVDIKKGDNQSYNHTYESSKRPKDKNKETRLSFFHVLSHRDMMRIQRETLISMLVVHDMVQPCVVVCSLCS